MCLLSQRILKNLKDFYTFLRKVQFSLGFSNFSNDIPQNNWKTLGFSNFSNFSNYFKVLGPGGAQITKIRKIIGKIGKTLGFPIIFIEIIGKHWKNLRNSIYLCKKYRFPQVFPIFPIKFYEIIGKPQVFPIFPIFPIILRSWGLEGPKSKKYVK